MWLNPGEFARSVDRARRGSTRGDRLQRRRPLCCEPLESRALLAANFSQLVDPNPAPGNQFGNTVLPLSTGNVVVTSPYDDYGGTDAGAVYLFNGATGALISTLRGSHNGDRIGLHGVTALSNGNYVVRSLLWDNGAVEDAGAATWGSGTAGVKGTVSAANSLVGDTAYDLVSNAGVTALKGGNYVVSSTFWSNGARAGAGAATWGNGTTGIKGIVSAANSLVGSRSNDQVGSSGVTALTGGNYVVGSPNWGAGATEDVGAATWGNGTTGVKGVVSAANSLIGSAINDLVGNSVTALTGGNYVVRSPSWDNGTAANAGAATWGSGTTGVKGVISAANSLVGSTLNDQVGGSGVTALTNGNYVVSSPYWNNSAVAAAGAATRGNGTTGVKGAISAVNSLVGTNANDNVGLGGVTALTNGNYVVSSPFWDNGAVADAGAATWGSGTAGVKGAVSTANSLVGSTAYDEVGYQRVTVLTNGNYVVRSPYWDGVAADAGAATWGSGTAGVQGVVSVANSLIGTNANDLVGNGGVTALANGNYVVSSYLWDNFLVAYDAGAATWGSGTTGITGAVSAANSLIGTTSADSVANGGVTALSNGNYVVSSYVWDNYGVAPDGGAATWGSGTTGIRGAVSTANSLVGSILNDQVSGSGVTALSNGNYVVRSPLWDNYGVAANAGAATWGSGTTGIKGAVSAANSLIGSILNDQVGGSGVTALTNGNYVVSSAAWDNGAAVDAGAATWGNGTAGVSGVINSQNSSLGAATNANLQAVVVDDVNGTFFARFIFDGAGEVRVGSQQNGFLPAPVIGNFGNAISYTENGSWIPVSSSATISDVDSPNFSQGELRINLKTGGTSDDRLRIRTQGTGTGQINVQGSQVRTGTIVLGTFAGGVGTAPLVVKLTSQATAFRVQQLLRNVVFYNVSQNPKTAIRTLRASLSDSDGYISNPVFKQIRINAVNDAPVLGLSGTVGYVHDQPAITLAAAATVSDVDSANLSGGRLRVRITNGASNSNRLAIGSGFTVDANNNVLRNGIVIGKRASNGFGTNELIVTFNTKATPFIVQQLVRAITFKTVGGAAGARKVVFTVSDGDGGLSTEAVKTVNVT